MLAKRHGLDPSASVRLGEIKNAVRLHEKAIAEYALAFDDWDDLWVLPEACVLDVLRARIVCPDAPSMLSLLADLRAGVDVPIDLSAARVRLVRCVHTFAPLAPSHARFVTAELLLTFNKRRIFFELQVRPSHTERPAQDASHLARAVAHVPTSLRAGVPAGMRMCRAPDAACRTEQPPSPPHVHAQVHHAAILAFHEASTANAHLAYFRRLLGGAVTPPAAELPALDASIEKALLFMQEVVHEPILLKLVVLILLSQPATSQSAVPLCTDRLTLYMCALELASSSKAAGASVLSLLTQLATANQLAAGRREFTIFQAAEALRGRPSTSSAAADGADGGGRAAASGDSLDEWGELVKSGTVPGIKIIQKGFESYRGPNLGRDVRGGLYAFRHISLQQALDTQSLVTTGAARFEAAPGGFDASIAELVLQPYNRNLAAIGGGKLGNVLGQVRRTWRLLDAGLDAGAAQALAKMLPGNTVSRCNRTQGGSGPAYALPFPPSPALPRSTALPEASVTDSMARATWQALTDLCLGGNVVGTGGCEALAVGLGANTTLSSLNLARNQLSSDAAKPIADGMYASCSLTELDLSDNGLGPRGAVLLAAALRINTVLTRLDLANNSICHDVNEAYSAAGVHAIAQVPCCDRT